MSTSIKCYGGCLHGETVHVDDSCSNRLYALDYRKQILKRYSYRYPEPLMYEPMFDRVTYDISWWHERRGNAQRRMEIAVLEGAELLPHEEYEVRHDLSKVAWEPVKEVSFLKTFERWWSWCMYRRTYDDYKYLIEEFMIHGY